MIRRFHDPALLELAERADAIDATMFLGILAALAAVAGIGRGIAGIVTGHKQGVAERTTIKQAYQVANRRMNEDQGYTRQGTTESLNARGILNAGAGTATTSNDRIFRRTSTSGISPTVRDALAAGGESGDLAKASMAGQTGDAGTLSGQTESDLSREFLGEHQDLATQRDQGLLASKRGQQAATLGSIGAGIDTAASVYSAGQTIQGAFAANAAAGNAASPTPAPSPGSPNYQPPVKPGSWFGGYDPTDPLGLTKKARNTLNSQFNVKTG